MKLSDFHIWLNKYLNFEKTQTKGIFWLETMRFMCEKLGNPQNKIPCIHIAGSKGKGSCSSMVSSILEESGFKCGVYTSPHISDFRERIALPHSFFDDEIYEKSADELTSIVDSIPLSELPKERPLTWFELVTLFAFLCFKNAHCDFAVYEVGLGGRLDSTNVINPLVSILMPIELEHTEFLGSTIKQIAGEKAGIIKNNVPAVIAPQNYKDADDVFKEKCKETNSECIFVKENIKNLLYKYNDNGMMNVQIHFDKKDKISANLRLLGKVQAYNALTAVTAVKKILPDISLKEIEKGLKKAYLPGRFEIVKNVVLDGAHTVKSILNVCETLKEVFPKKKYVLLFACAGDKDIKDIVQIFKGKFDSIIFTEPLTVRHCDALLTQKIASEYGVFGKVIKNVQQALNESYSNAGKENILLVTGSFYLVSEVKNLIQ